MSKFQIVKGITDNLTETPYVEGKVYFVYDDINSTDLSIYADIDGARRKITPTTFEEEDPKIHILTLQEDENEELTTGEDESISSYVNNNELVIIYYDGKPYFYDKNSDRGLYFNGINGNNLLRYYSTTENKMVWHINNNYYATQSNLPTNVSELNNDAGYITEETDPTVPAWAKESTKPTYTAAEVGALPDTTEIPDEKLKTERVSNDGTYYLIFGENNNTTSSIKNIDTNLKYTKSSSSGDKLEIGSRSITAPKKGSITLSNGTTTGTTITPQTISQSVTITLPKSTGTLALMSDIPTVPENTSDLTNDSGFQTSTEVNSAIAAAIGNINQFNVAIVSTLPTENIDAHTIYFMSNGGSDDSIYDEWMYINNNWEKIGTTSIDLSGYMQTSHPANGITNTDINNWNAKVSDTKTWGNIVLGNSRSDTSDNRYVVQFTSTSNTNTTTSFAICRPEPFALGIPKWDNYQYLYASTPSANDNSTKVATTEYVNAAIPDVSGYVSKSGDTMNGDLSFADSKGIELNYSGYKDKLYLIGYGPSTRTASFEYKTELRNIQAPTNKEYVDNKIPKVYSSTNTNGYLTMATLPIYDGTVE